MLLLVFVVAFFSLLLLAYADELIALIRRSRRWLRDDIRHRVSDDVWEKMKYDFDDL